MANLPPRSWMTEPATKAVIAALTAEGTEVRFVGGCVRDGILNRPVTDIDIATPDAPARVIELLEAAGLKAVPTGIDHGTVTAGVHRPAFVMATLCRGVEAGGPRAEGAFTGGLGVECSRRGFTLQIAF